MLADKLSLEFMKVYTTINLFVFKELQEHLLFYDGQRISTFGCEEALTK